MRIRLLLMIALVALTGTRAASAQNDPAEARRAEFEKGWDALEAKDYAEAYRILSALYAEKPTYDVALNLGAAEYQLAKYQQAATHLAYGVRNAPPGEDAETLERAKRGLERVKQQFVGTLNVRTNQPGAEVRVNGAAVGSAPLDAPVFVTPGRYTVEVAQVGYQSAKREIQVSAGQELSLVLDLGAGAAQPGAAAPGSEPTQGAQAQGGGVSTRTIALISGAAVTGAAAITMGVFAIMANSADREAEDLQKQAQVYGPSACANPPAAPSDICASLREANDDRAAASTGANVALAVTGVAALTTTVMFFVWPTSKEKRTSGVRLQPTVSPKFVGLNISGQL